MSKKYPLLDDKEWLYQKYWIERLSIYKIAEIVECCPHTVFNALKRCGIQIWSRSEANRRRKHSEETKQKIREANIGKGVSKETREKLSESHKGERNPMYGKHLSEEHKRILLEIHKGNKYWLGKHHTEATKQKISAAQQGEKHWKITEEIRQKLREARKHQKFPKKDTKPELIFIDCYHRFGLTHQVVDTRDNSFHIGRVHPDFIIRDKKIAIFINGDYWHSALLRPDLKYTSRPENQIKICKRHKWKAVIIWESDLKRKDAEAFVLSLLKREKVI